MPGAQAAGHELQRVVELVGERRLPPRRHGTSGTAWRRTARRPGAAARGRAHRAPPTVAEHDRGQPDHQHEVRQPHRHAGPLEGCRSGRRPTALEPAPSPRRRRRRRPPRRRRTPAARPTGRAGSAARAPAPPGRTTRARTSSAAATATTPTTSSIGDMVTNPPGGRLGRPEDPRGQPDPEVVELVGEPRPHAGGHRLAEELAVRVDAGGVVEEEGVLEGDGLPSMPCTSVTCVTRRVPSRSRVICTTTSTAEAICSRIARSGRSMPAMSTRVSRRAIASRGRVGVHGGQRAVVAGVHRLEHVQGLAAAALADDDAVGPHAERVAHQVADGDRALALDVGRPRLQPDDVLLLELQLDGVLDGDDPLAVRDERRQHVEQRRLARCRYRRRRSR